MAHRDGDGNDVAAEERPLISFCIVCFNQEKYIKEVLSGAFAQTYSPMEIVISDDCSSDNTWRIIGDEVAAYRVKDGKHTIVLNRNDHNLGIYANSAKVYELAHGVIHVGNDGDDYSYPSRVATIYSVFKSNANCSAVAHCGRLMHLDGKPMSLIRQATFAMPFGCMMAWKREVSGSFGPMRHKDAAADLVIAFRAKMCGDCIEIPDVLMNYRVGSGLTSVRFNQRKPAIRGCNGGILALEQAFEDLEYIHPRISHSKYLEIKLDIESMLSKFKLRMTLMAGNRILERWRAFKMLGLGRRFSKEAILGILYVLPLWLGNPLLNLLSICKFGARKVGLMR